MLKGKRIMLGITGGIAVYKVAALTSKLTQAGAEVRVVMTESATRFVAPLTFETLSKNYVMTDTFAEKDPRVVGHIAVADWAEVAVIVPATANILGKLAHGIADDLLSTVLLAVSAPVIAAPAMNVHMYDHPAVQENMDILRRRGVRFIEPGTGNLACGYVGKGRMEEPENIFTYLEGFFREKKALQGKKIVVTAGGTVERIDPVRYITNDSSGKMGYAIAEAARDMGAEVTLITGKASVQVPAGVAAVSAPSAMEMYDEVMKRLPEADVVIKAAAVADYRPVERADRKIKKSENRLTLELVKNPDILQAVGERKTSQFIVGFAAETDRLEEHAMDKLCRKNCDLLVANDVTLPGAGFESDTNAVHIFDRNGKVEELSLRSKRDVAERLLLLIAERLEHRSAAERASGCPGENAELDDEAGR